MRLLLLATLSISCLGRVSNADTGDVPADVTTRTPLLRAGNINGGGSAAAGGAAGGFGPVKDADKANKPALFTENDETQDEEELAPAPAVSTSDHNDDDGGGLLTNNNMKMQKRKKQKKRKKNKRKKRSKNGKGSKDSSDNGDRDPESPTPSPPGDNKYSIKYVDGGDHKLPPHSNHNNIVLESGSTLTVTSGTSIVAKGGTYNRGIASAISVSESSLKVQGMQITIMGSSYMDHEDANFGGVGGDAITFLPGSKGMIGCDAFQPPPVDPPVTNPPSGTNKVQCAMGHAAPPQLTNICGLGEFCQLSKGVCNNKSGAHYGVCTRKSEVCPMVYRPVCGCDGETYGNSCSASSAGASVSRDGPCDWTGEPPVEPPVERMYCEIDSMGGHPCREDEICLLDTGTCHLDHNHPDHDHGRDHEYSGFNGRDIDMPLPKMSMNSGTCVKTKEYCDEMPKNICTCDGKTYPSECDLFARSGSMASMARLVDVGVAYRGVCRPTDPPEPPPEPLRCEIDSSGGHPCKDDEVCLLDAGTCSATARTDYDFEDGTFPAEWKTGGNGLWEITTEKANKGRYSIRSPNLVTEDRIPQSSNLTFVTDPDWPSGNLFFSMHASVQMPFDSFEYFVDGDMRFRYNEGNTGPDEEFETLRIPLSPGQHTITFSYRYNPIGIPGQNLPPTPPDWVGAVFIDDVHLEPHQGSLFDTPNKSLGNKGICVKTDEYCHEIPREICSCDGTTYPNECAFKSMGSTNELYGMGVAYRGSCKHPPEPPPEPTMCQIHQSGRNDCNADEFCMMMPVNCDTDYIDRDSMNVGVCMNIDDGWSELPRQVCTCDGETLPNESAVNLYGKRIAYRGVCDIEPVRTCEVDSRSGRSMNDCRSDEYCLLPFGTCQLASLFGMMAEGLCTPLPSNCDEEPVCGCDNETYQGKCHAYDAGVGISHQGECGSGGPPPLPPVLPPVQPPVLPPIIGPPLRRCEVGPLALPFCFPGEFCEIEMGTCEADSTVPIKGVGACRELPFACTQEYDPVCGCDGKTYGNYCSARGQRMSIAHKGECEGDKPVRPPIVQPPVRKCESGPGVIHFACNRGEYCDIEPGVCKVGSWDVNRGICKPRPDRGCPEIYQPVCGCDGRNYDNDCFAKARGMSISYKGKCEDTLVSTESVPEDPEIEELKIEPPVIRPMNPIVISRPVTQCDGPDQCVNSFTGECDKIFQCFVDPCIFTTCLTGSVCQADYCGGCNAKCVDPSIIDKPVECDDSMIVIMGGEGDRRADGGNGRGGVAIRVHGQTNVQIKGATLSGGMGSIRGLAMEIAEAEVTIHSAIADGGILVAKRGSLHVHGGTFTGGEIEVLGDTSSVTFYGCFDYDNMMHDEEEDHINWSFSFLGEKSMIRVLVHQGGEIAWDESGHDCSEIVDPALPPDPCEPGCLNPLTGMCTTVVVRCREDPCLVPGACMSNESCTANYCGGCNAVCTTLIETVTGIDEAEEKRMEEALFLGP